MKLDCFVSHNAITIEGCGLWPMDHIPELSWAIHYLLPLRHLFHPHPLLQRTAIVVVFPSIKSPLDVDDLIGSGRFTSFSSPPVAKSRCVCERARARTCTCCQALHNAVYYAGVCQPSPVIGIYPDGSTGCCSHLSHSNLNVSGRFNLATKQL